MTKLVIFDWDGTLSDSLSQIVESIKLAASSMGLPARSDEQNCSIIGLGLQEALAVLYPEISHAVLSELVAAYRKHYIGLYTTAPSSLFAGVDAMLKRLVDDGYILAVATGKSRSGIERVFDSTGTRQYFAASRGADETKSKPDPLMLQQILDELSLDASQSVMVGDTDFDIAMGQNAQMPTIAVTYGAHSVERLLAQKPTSMVDSVAAVEAEIRRLLPIGLASS